jgi:hypothetical protein
MAPVAALIAVCPSPWVAGRSFMLSRMCSQLSVRPAQ